MPKYKVKFEAGYRIQMEGFHEVEADTPEDALEIAIDLDPPDMREVERKLEYYESDITDG